MKNCLYSHLYLQLKNIFRLKYSLTGITSSYKKKGVNKPEK